MPFIASMGIYVVSKNVMLDLLREQFPGANDFGSEVIPGATALGLRVCDCSLLVFFAEYLSASSFNIGFFFPLIQVQAYLYDGYWEDIGTIEAFYNANLGITKKPVPDFRYSLIFRDISCGFKR